MATENDKRDASGSCGLKPDWTCEMCQDSVENKKPLSGALPHLYGAIGDLDASEMPFWHANHPRRGLNACGGA